MEDALDVVSECVLCAVCSIVQWRLIYGKIADPGFNYLLRVNQEVVLD